MLASVVVALAGLPAVANAQGPQSVPVDRRGWLAGASLGISSQHGGLGVGLVVSLRLCSRRFLANARKAGDAPRNSNTKLASAGTEVEEVSR